MAEGWVGIGTVEIVSVCGVPLPQLLLAVTDTLPDAEVVVRLMLFVVDEPVHPVG